MKSNETPQKPLVKFLVCDLPHPTLVSRFLLSMFELAAICDTLICICFTWNEGASSGTSLSEWAAAELTITRFLLRKGLENGCGRVLEHITSDVRLVY